MQQSTAGWRCIQSKFVRTITRGEPPGSSSAQHLSRSARWAVQNQSCSTSRRSSSSSTSSASPPPLAAAVAGAGGAVAGAPTPPLAAASSWRPPLSSASAASSSDRAVADTTSGTVNATWYTAGAAAVAAIATLPLLLLPVRGGDAFQARSRSDDPPAPSSWSLPSSVRSVSPKMASTLRPALTGAPTVGPTRDAVAGSGIAPAPVATRAAPAVVAPPALRGSAAGDRGERPAPARLLGVVCADRDNDC